MLGVYRALGLEFRALGLEMLRVYISFRLLGYGGGGALVSVLTGSFWILLL